MKEIVDQREEEDVIEIEIEKESNFHHYVKAEKKVEWYSLTERVKRF